MKKLLLHTCCAPCGTSVFERLLDEKEIETTSFYYNPNIKPSEEWEKRRNELERLVGIMNISLVIAEQNVGEFDRETLGMEDEPERGDRCEICFRLRLARTAEYAKANGFEVFGTTLTVSPHKNSEMINRIGIELAREYGLKFLERDWKGNDGYKRSIELCRELGIYRQRYCGCIA